MKYNVIKVIEYGETKGYTIYSDDISPDNDIVLIKDDDGNVIKDKALCETICENRLREYESNLFPNVGE